MTNAKLTSYPRSLRRRSSPSTQVFAASQTAFSSFGLHCAPTYCPRMVSIRVEKGWLSQSGLADNATRRCYRIANVVTEAELLAAGLRAKPALPVHNQRYLFYLHMYHSCCFGHSKQFGLLAALLVVIKVDSNKSQ